VFALLGIVVAAYAGYGVVTGSIAAKDGVGMTIVRREDSPAYFWCVTACYALLALALVLVF
jgi:hypothetical protein